MSGGVVTVGRRPYVSGLYWENSPSGRVVQAAKEAAIQPGMQAQFFAVRAGNKNGRIPQFGLSQDGVGHKSGMPAIAPCLANQQPGSWAGAFRLREGTAVIVVRDDLIVPDGDMFFEDETEARDRLLQEMALGGLQKIYAPETWGISGSDSMPIALLLNDKTDVRLRSVAMSRQAMLMVGGGALVLVALLGAVVYFQQQAEKDAELKRRQTQAILDAKKRARDAIPGLPSAQPNYPPPERKWEKRPEALLVIQACSDSFKKAPVAVAGWKLTSVKCDDAGLVEKWSRSGGFSSPPSTFVLNDAASSATVTIVHDQKPTPRGPQELVDPDVITKRYLAQSWSGTVRSAPDDPPPSPPPNHKGPWNPPKPPWVKRSFTLSAPVLPWTLPAFLEGLPGIVINSLSSTIGGVGGTWTIDGVIYENRPKK